MRERAGSEYRGDIDGLRAVAVGSVVVFHVNPAWLPGGFIGVDIFFVISGFLITRQIHSDLELNKFSFREFYRRRIKRIIPVLSLVILSTLAVAHFMMLPDDIYRLAESAIAFQLLFGNIYFTYYLDTSHIAGGAAFEPLLHLWSLGVEEQYYLLWPLLCSLFVIRLRLEILLATMLVAAASSFYFGEIYFQEDSKFVYNMLPTRAGELLAGAIIHFLVQRVRQVPCALSWAAGFIGSSLIVYSLIRFSVEDVFPGLNAIPVTLGAALLILAGLNANLISKVLMIRPVIGIGLISYSMYLWHWPVLVFAKYAYGALAIWQSMICLIIILVLSILSYRFVEAPLRASGSQFPRLLLRQFLAPSAVVAAVCLGLLQTGGLGLYGISGSYSQTLARITEGGRPNHQADYVCQFGQLTEEVIHAEYCVLGPDKHARILLWGDSNAAHYVPALKIIAEQYGFTFRNFEHSSCPPLVEAPERFTPAKSKTTCRKSVDLARDALDDYETIMLSASWDFYLSGGKEKFVNALNKTIQYLVKMNKRVVLIGRIPRLAYFDKNCSLKSIKIKFMDCRFRAFVESRYVRQVNTSIREIAERNGVDYIDLNQHLCEGEICYGYNGNDPLYYDRGHLSISGSEELGRRVITAGTMQEFWRSLSPQSEAH